eukprot:scaffold11297_cov140-Amphora_coffeaeformis.AAC.3
MEDRTLGENSRPKTQDFQKAIAELIPNIENLHNARKVPVLASLVFLHMNGVKKATGNWGTPVPILRDTLMCILYPDDVPQREPSLSPASKQQKQAAAIAQEAKEARRLVAGERAAKRASPEFLSAKGKMRRVLTAEEFATVFPEDAVAVGEDGQDGDDDTNDATNNDDAADDTEMDLAFLLPKLARKTAIKTSKCTTKSVIKSITEPIPSHASSVARHPSHIKHST